MWTLWGREKQLRVKQTFDSKECEKCCVPQCYTLMNSGLCNCKAYKWLKFSWNLPWILPLPTYECLLPAQFLAVRRRRRSPIWPKHEKLSRSCNDAVRKRGRRQNRFFCNVTGALIGRNFLWWQVWNFKRERTLFVVKLYSSSVLYKEPEVVWTPPPAPTSTIYPLM